MWRLMPACNKRTVSKRRGGKSAVNGVKLALEKSRSGSMQCMSFNDLCTAPVARKRKIVKTTSNSDLSTADYFKIRLNCTSHLILAKQPRILTQAFPFATIANSGCFGNILLLSVSKIAVESGCIIVLAFNSCFTIFGVCRSRCISRHLVCILRFSKVL